MTGYVRDISLKRREELSRLKQAEDKLKEYRDKLESMVKEKTAGLSEKVIQLETQKLENTRFIKAIDQAAELIMIMNAVGTVEYANPPITNFMGYDLKEIIGTNILKMSHKLRPELYNKVLTIINKGEAWN